MIRSLAEWQTTRAMVLRSLFLILWVSLAWPIASVSPVFAETRRVVLLFDERVELPGMSRLDAEFVRTLQANSADPVEVYREAMDLSRFGSDTYKSSLRDFLRIKYADKKIDVAVAVMAPAFEFLSKYGKIIFPGAPIVFCGLDAKQLGKRPLPPDWRGVLVKREFAPALDMVLRVHPETREIVVVSGTSEFDDTILAEARNAFRAYESRLTFTYLSDLPFQSLLSILSHLPSDNIIFFTTLFQDGAGKPFTPHEALERISVAASVPIYASSDDQYLGRGIVGGRLYSYASHGADTAKLVLRLLSGDAPSQPVAELTTARVAFDWRQLQRWGISEYQLPQGAEIDFRDPSALERYRWLIVIVSVIILTQSLLISGLLHQRRRAHAAELQSRQRMSALARVNRFATAGELTASIAHEINQPLGAIQTNAETLDLILKSSSPDMAEIREIVADIRRDQERASEVIRRLRSLFRKAPFELREIDLNDIVRETEKLVSSLSAIAVARRVDVSTSTTADPLPVIGDRIQLQQAILNLIVNAIDAMADASSTTGRIVLRTTRIPDFAEVTVSDTGPGIPPEKTKEVFEPFFTTKAGGMGIGLTIVRTIVEVHGGQIFVENQVGGGAMFRIRLPLASARGS